MANNDSEPDLDEAKGGEGAYGSDATSPFDAELAAIDAVLARSDAAIEKARMPGIQLLWDVLGTKAFTVLDPSKRLPTKIVYDPLMFIANSHEVVTHRDALIAQKEELRAELKAMY